MATEHFSNLTTSTELSGLVRETNYALNDLLHNILEFNGRKYSKKNWSCVKSFDNADDFRFVTIFEYRYKYVNKA